MYRIHSSQYNSGHKVIMSTFVESKNILKFSLDRNRLQTLQKEIQDFKVKMEEVHEEVIQICKSHLVPYFL